MMARLAMGVWIAPAAMLLTGCTFPDMEPQGYAPPPAVGEFGQDAADYAWIDRADALWDAIGQAPPDFTLASGDGDDQWVWVTADGYSVITEPVGRDGVRGYYFEPGATLPFLVRDVDTSYGFTGDRLAVVYGRDGRVSDAIPSPVERANAIGLLRRGAMLREAADGQGRRGRVQPELWAGSAPILWNSFATWDFGYAADPLWGSYRNSPRSRADRERWRFEREERRARAEAFREWRGRQFMGDPPPILARPGRPRPDGRPPRPGDGAGAGSPPPLYANPDPVRRPVRREDALRPDRPERAPIIRPARPVTQPGAAEAIQRQPRQELPGRRPAPVAGQPQSQQWNAPPPATATGRAQPTRPLYSPDRAAGRATGRPTTPMVRPVAPSQSASPPPPPPPRAAPPPPPPSPPPRIMEAPTLSPELRAD